MRKFLILVLLLAAAVSSKSQSIKVTFDIDDLGSELKHGVDAKLSLKDWAESPQAEELIERLFVDDGFTVFRIPIYAMRPIDDPFYQKVVKLARLAREANPDLILFASVANGDGDEDNNLHGAHKFPLSMRCGDEEKGCDNGRIYNLDLDAYAAYLDAFIQMMEDNGVSIDWIGPWNEDPASADDVAYMWKRMKKEKGLVRVGVETWALQAGINKVRSLQGKHDVIGSHFYDDEQGKVIPKELWDEKWSQLLHRSKKPVWFTEATDYREAEIDEAHFLVKAMERLIVAANAGVEGIIYYQTVPRIVGYDNEPVELKHSGIFNFVSKSQRAARVPTNRLSNVNTRLYAHFNEGSQVLGVHIANSDKETQTFQLDLGNGYPFVRERVGRIWNEESIGDAVSLLKKNDDGTVSVDVPTESYVYLELEMSEESLSTTPPAPLFVDPNYQGSCDPEIVWNEREQEWWIFYTARRALHDETFVATPLGVVASKDLIHWEFRGYCSFDGVKGVKDYHETFWAPAICRDGDTYHMFVTWKMDTDTTRGQWGGPGYVIQYSAPADDLLHGWKEVQKISKLEERALDATIWKDGDTWKLWYKGKKGGGTKSSLIAMQSDDLLNWELDESDTGEVFNKEATGYGFEEAPFFFEWKGKKWLITDPHKGLLVYESDDARSWKLNNVILKKGGNREQDWSKARHCSVLVKEGRAFIFYHVEPWRDYDTPPFKQPQKNRRAALQMAELKLVDGKLVCNRDERIIIEP